MGAFGALMFCIVVFGCCSSGEGWGEPPEWLVKATGWAVCLAILVGAYFLGGHHP